MYTHKQTNKKAHLIPTNLVMSIIWPCGVRVILATTKISLIIHSLLLQDQQSFLIRSVLEKPVKLKAIRLPYCLSLSAEHKSCVKSPISFSFLLSVNTLW